MRDLSPLRQASIPLLGLFLTVTAIAIPYLLDRPLWNGAAVQFRDPAGDELVGTYYAGEIDAGVLLLEGFGSDQVTMRSAAAEFGRDGYHVFTFDFSGHGRSPGTLDYDNAATPRLAEQTLAAVEQFRALSGLPEGRIVLLGHSLGARVALQAATMEAEPAGLILMGTQVNLGTNTQAEFFTGVSDNELAWVQELGPNNPPVPLLLLSGAWDDILTPEAARLLAARLNGAPVAAQDAFQRRSGSGRDLVIMPAMVHNYEVFAPRAVAAAGDWAADLLGLEAEPAGAPAASLRIICWLVGYAGLVVMLLGAGQWGKRYRPPSQPTAGPVTIDSLRRFLGVKVLLWLLALPLGGALAGAFFFLPVGLPTFNLIYVAVFGGYGILLYLLYRTGRLPGTSGRLSFAPSLLRDRAGTVTALAITALLLLLTAAYARSGWFYVFPLNERLLWLMLFTIPTALGLWIGLYEIEMISRAAPGRPLAQVAGLLIGILPFFLYTGFLALIGSLSGVIGGVQGLLILGLALALGYLLRQVTRAHWLTALAQAFLLYWLILPQGVLFG